jgi:hypothetical protein
MNDQNKIWMIRAGIVLSAAAIYRRNKKAKAIRLQQRVDQISKIVEVAELTTEFAKWLSENQDRLHEPEFRIEYNNRVEFINIVSAI